MGEQMKIIYELSWLWETLGIALMAAVVCVVGAMLICRAKKEEAQQEEHSSYRDCSLYHCHRSSD